MRQFSATDLPGKRRMREFCPTDCVSYRKANVLPLREASRGACAPRLPRKHGIASGNTKLKHKTATKTHRGFGGYGENG